MEDECRLDVEKELPIGVIVLVLLLVIEILLSAVAPRYVEAFSGTAT